MTAEDYVKNIESKLSMENGDTEDFIEKIGQFVDDSLDVTISSHLYTKTYMGATLLLTYGGPTVTLDLPSGKVSFSHGDEKSECNLPERLAMFLDDEVYSRAVDMGIVKRE